MEKKVCVIEDNTPNRKLFVMLLKKSGYEVFDFADAQSALDWLKTNEVAFVLMDILLPDMNGMELIQYVREIPKMQNKKIIAITAFTSTSDQQKFSQVGFDGFVSKPVNTSTFVKEIEAFL